MSHPFYKSAKNTSGVPGRVQGSSYEKLKKFAHDVWEIDGSNDDPVVVRKRQETADLNYEKPQELSVGDIVLFLLGGTKYQARVAAISADGDQVQVGETGYWIPKWLIEKQGQGVPLTAEDPLPEAPAPVMNETADSLQRLMQSRGGHIAVRISQSTVLELQQQGQGVIATLWEVSTRAAHRGTYPSVGDVVQELNISGYPTEVPVEYLHPR